MTDTSSTGKTTRAQRMAMPLAREVVRDLAVEHGACIRPIQLRRTQPGHRRDRARCSSRAGTPSAIVCPACAERARTLRAAQCREGWHLEDEPDLSPDPATDDQRWWCPRAEAQQSRDQAADHDQDTADFDALIAELDEEITSSGVRGKAAPDRPARGTAPPAAARTPPTCPRARSARGRWARATPRRTARPSARRCSSR